MAYARNVRVKETHSIASQLKDTVCIICPFVSIIVLHSGAGRRARRRRSGAAQITVPRSRWGYVGSNEIHAMRPKFA